MFNYNFLRVNAFILIMLLLFSVSVYDPSVYAKMQVIEDDDLAQIEAQTGITINLNMTVNSVANNIIISDGTDSIYFGTPGASSPNVFIGLGTNPAQPVSVVTNIDQDVGVLNGLVYLRQRFVNGLPGDGGSNAGIGILINNIGANIKGQTVSLGNLLINGIYMGVNAITSTSTPYGSNVVANLITGTTGMETYITPHASGGTGFSFWSRQSAYINNLTWTVGTSTSPFSVSGIYMYGANTTIADGNPANWGTLTGYSQVGNNGTSSDFAQVDIGSNGSANGTVLRLYLTATGSTRIASISLGGQNFGPSATDNMNLSRLILTIRNLNASGY